MNRRGFLRGAAVTISVMALAGRLKSREPDSSSFGLAPVKAEGTSIPYDEIGDRYSKALAKSMLQTREITMAEALKDAPEYTHQVFATQAWWKA